MKIYGLTGGIASGKSTVSARLEQHGIPVIDSDIVAREVVEPGSPGLRALAEAFGPGILHADGSLHREALGALVFGDAAARARLNSITHPLILERTAAQVQSLREAGAPLLVMSIPLLFEVRDPSDFDAVIVVYVDEDTQRSRLMERNGYTAEQAMARIGSQRSLEEKRALADVVIDNRGSLENTLEQVDALAERLKALANVPVPQEE